MITPSPTHFFCSYKDLTERIQHIDPRKYDKTRNYLDGHVTWLSPFTTHGVISAPLIAHTLLAEHKAKSCYRLLFELGWREFFHRTWQLEKDSIFNDMRHSPIGIRSEKIPKAIVDANTGIQVVDSCLKTLVQEGVMHNHARMWVAGITCNMSMTHWSEPAKWLHYHLLDGDLASNTLSWQWIAGTFSNKRYVANQDNIDKYSKQAQPGSWLDISYEDFDHLTVPESMLDRCAPEFNVSLPGLPITPLTDKVALHSIWHLDPLWRNDIEQHIVFIDTDLHERWPMSPLRWRFIKHWATLCGAAIYSGSLRQLQQACEKASVVRTEYPACEGWPGEVEERSWLYPMPEQSFNSFSQYFKQVKHHVGL